MSLLSEKPKYIEIAELFRSRIHSGELRFGDKILPSSKLAKRYNLDQRTVSAGLNLLVKEGLLERKPGRGTIVKGDGNNIVYLLIPCPGFIEENSSTSARFFRRLSKHLQLHLMENGGSLITVPMSPTNRPDDILEKYFDLIPDGAKVIYPAMGWGIRGLNSLVEKNCNLVYYEQQLDATFEVPSSAWKRFECDRSKGAYKAIRLLAEKGFKRPLIFIEHTRDHKQLRPKGIKTLEAVKEFFPELPQENVVRYNREWGHWQRSDRKIEEQMFMDNLRRKNFDSIFFGVIIQHQQVIKHIKEHYINVTVSNDCLEMFSLPECCHVAYDFNVLAQKTLKLFACSQGASDFIEGKLYNTQALNDSRK